MLTPREREIAARLQRWLEERAQKHLLSMSRGLDHESYLKIVGSFRETQEALRELPEIVREIDQDR